MRRSHREQYDVFRSELVRGAQFSPLFEFPQLKAVYCKPARAVPFEKACTVSNHDQWVHFYTHDRNFERIWSNPKRYLPILQRFTGVIPQISACIAKCRWPCRYGIPIVIEALRIGSNVKMCPSYPMSAGGMSVPMRLPSRGWLKAAQWLSARMARCAVKWIENILNRDWLTWWRFCGLKPSSTTVRRRTIFLARTRRKGWKLLNSPTTRE